MTYRKVASDVRSNQLYYLGLQVKDSLNVVADTWTDEEKAHCLDETTVSFQVCACACHSAALMSRQIACLKYFSARQSQSQF